MKYIIEIFKDDKGTPKDNEAKYCLFCGRELIQNEYLSEAIEED